jgi:hypothetical protein
VSDDTVLTEARSILVRSAEGPASVLFQQDVDPGEQPRFELLMALPVYTDLGEPERVTLSVQPGDLLNVDEGPVDRIGDLIRDGLVDGGGVGG